MLPTINLHDIRQEIKIYACNSKYETIARIKEADNKEYDINIGRLNELSFTIPLFMDDIHTGVQKNTHADLLVDHAILRVKYDNMEELFVIDSHEDSDTDQKRSIHAFSLGFQLGNRFLYGYTSQTTTTTTDSNGNTVTQKVDGPIPIDQALNDAVSVSMIWSIDYIDPALKEIYRYFQVDNQSALEYIYNIGTSYDCIIIWDTLKQKISAYHPDNYGSNRGFKITDKNYISSLTKKSSDDEFATRLYLYGKDGLTVNSVSATGTGYIDDFTYFMSTGLMTQDLIDALNNYNSYVNSRANEWPTLLNQLNTDENNLTTLNSNLSDLQNQKIIVQNNIDVLTAANDRKDFSYTFTSSVTENDTYSASENRIILFDITQIDSTNTPTITINGQSITYVSGTETYCAKFTGNCDFVFTNSNSTTTSISGMILKVSDSDYALSTDDLISKYSLTRINALINSKQTDVNNKQSAVNSDQSQINSYQSDIDISNHLTADQLKELDQFIIEKDYTDDNCTDAQSLLNSGKAQLQTRNQPQLSFDISIINFLSSLEEKRNWGKLTLFDIVRIKSDNIDTDITARITNMKITEDDIGLTIANTKDMKTQFDKYIQLLYGTANSTKTLQKKEFTWDKAVDTSTTFDNYMKGELDATKQKIIAGINETVQIDTRGIKIFSPSDPNTFLVMNNGVVAITKDNGQTFENALTSDGLVADKVVGKLIASANLTIVNDQGTFSVDGSKVTIDGGSLTITGGLPKSQMDSTATSTWDSVATNFNNNNDRISTLPANPSIATDGSAIDHTINTDGSCDISFEWVFNATGNAGNVDGFYVYVYAGNSSGSYSFGTSTSNEQVLSVPYDKRAVIIRGVAANLFYTFGIQAYRMVDTDINSSGILKSAIIKSTATGEDPYQPATSVAFAGDITGTINGTSASTVATNATNALQVGTTYNSVKIDSNSGLVATRSDNKSRTIINATGGMKIQYSSDGGSTWIDKFYADTNGVISAKGLSIQSDDGSSILIDAKNKKIDFSQFTTIAGQLSASNINATSLSAISANLGTVTAGSISGVTISTSGTYGTITLQNDVVKSVYGSSTASIYSGILQCVSGSYQGSYKADSLQVGYTSNYSTLNYDMLSLNNGGMQVTDTGSLSTTSSSFSFNKSASFMGNLTLQGSSNTVSSAQLTLDSSGFIKVVSDSDYVYLQSNYQISCVKPNTTSTYIPVYASSFNTSSNRAWKTDIQNYTKSAKDIIKGSPIRTYKFKPEWNDEKEYVGLIADEAPKEILNDTGEFIQLYPMLTLAWKAIQELSEEVNYLHNKLKNR